MRRRHRGGALLRARGDAVEYGPPLGADRADELGLGGRLGLGGHGAALGRGLGAALGAGVGGRLATIRGSVDGACSEARVTLDADVAAAKRVATKAGDVSPKSLTGGPGSSVSSGD